MRAVLAYGAAWALLSWILPLEQRLLPDFLCTLKEGVSLLRQGQLARDLAITMVRTFSGVVAALVIGAIVGLGFARKSWYRKFVAPALDFIRSIPVAMLFPLFIVVAGIGELSRFLMVLTLATPILIVSIVSGVDGVLALIDQRAWFGLHDTSIPRWVKIANLAWSLMPGILAGIKTAISLGLVMVVVSEMLFVASSGVGYAAYQAYNSFAMQRMYAYVLVTGLCGLAMNIVVDRLASFFRVGAQYPVRERRSPS